MPLRAERTAPVDREAALRREMVARYVEPRGVDDPRVLEALRQVPRHCFVPEPLRSKAYGDHSLDKSPPRQPAGLDVCNQVSKFPFFHGAGSSLAVNAWSFSTLEMDQVSANLSKQDPGHPVVPGPTETR